MTGANLKTAPARDSHEPSSWVSRPKLARTKRVAAPGLGAPHRGWWACRDQGALPLRRTLVTRCGLPARCIPNGLRRPT